MTETRKPLPLDEDDRALLFGFALAAAAKRTRQAPAHDRLAGLAKGLPEGALDRFGKAAARTRHMIVLGFVAVFAAAMLGGWALWLGFQPPGQRIVAMAAAAFFLLLGFAVYEGHVRGLRAGVKASCLPVPAEAEGDRQSFERLEGTARTIGMAISLFGAVLGVGIGIVFTP